MVKLNKSIKIDKQFRFAIIVFLSTERIIENEILDYQHIAVMDVKKFLYKIFIERKCLYLAV